MGIGRIAYEIHVRFVRFVRNPLQLHLDLTDKILAAFFKAVILIKACRRRGQQNGFSRLGLVHGAGHGHLHCGAGLGFTHAAVVLEETGRALLPAPLLPAMLAGLTVAETEVLRGDVAASEDGVLVISDQQLVVHALIKPRETSDELDTLCDRARTLAEGVEDADLHIRVETQACDRTRPAPQLQIIDNEPDGDAAIGRSDQTAEEQIPDQLKHWIADILEDVLPTPKKPRGGMTTGLENNFLLPRLVEKVAVKFQLERTRNDASDQMSACDAVHQAITKIPEARDIRSRQYGTIKRAYLAAKKRGIFVAH